MPKLAKIMLGLAAAFALGWLAYAPLGQGEAFADQLDSDLQRVLGAIEVPGVTGSVQRDPLTRTALLSGPANCFQRRGDASFEGERDGTFPGLDQRVLTVPGLARLEWTNPPPGGETCR